MNPNLGSYPRPRRCERCDAPVLIGAWGTPLEDRWRHKRRGEKHRCRA